MSFSWLSTKQQRALASGLALLLVMLALGFLTIVFTIAEVGESDWFLLSPPFIFVCGGDAFFRMFSVPERVSSLLAIGSLFAIGYIWGYLIQRRWLRVVLIVITLGILAYPLLFLCVLTIYW